MYKNVYSVVVNRRNRSIYSVNQQKLNTEPKGVDNECYFFRNIIFLGYIEEYRLDLWLPKNGEVWYSSLSDSNIIIVGISRNILDAKIQEWIEDGYKKLK